MSLQSFAFFGFLLIAAAVYLVLPQKLQTPFLLAASLLFYWQAVRAGNSSALAVLLGVCAFTYLCGRGLAGTHKAFCLRLGVVGTLGILAFFKYLSPLPMPLGISFFSFAAIAYLVDAARGDCEIEKNPLRYALFFCFFATVTQGPICRGGQLLPQFGQEHRFDVQRTVRALRLFGLGLFKLVAVSDVLGVLVDEVFGHSAAYGGGMHLLAAVGYTLQLYFNFSGYSEVARAAGLLLGLDLPENFKTPFFATNFSGFWSRWHISFSGWLQDYLFMPLAWADTEKLTHGKWSRLPTELVIFCVFFASGFWHGNTLLFVVWGLLQALYRVGEELLHRKFGKPKKKAPQRVLWGKRAGVFALWTFSMVFFRVGSGAGGTLTGAGQYLLGCVTGLSPLRFIQELYNAVYTAFYANPLMVYGYWGFLLAALALAFYLDYQRAFSYKNKPAEVSLAGEKHRHLLYYLLVIGILVGYIMQSGGFGSSGFGMYAGF